MKRFIVGFFTAGVVIVLAACGGGGGSISSGGSIPSTPTNAPTATAMPTQQPASETVPITAAATSAPVPATSGFSGTITLPSSDVSGTADLVISASATQPTGLAPMARRRMTLPANAQVLFWLQITAPQTITFSAYPGLQLNVPSGIGSNGSLYVAGYDPVAQVWTEPLIGPVVVSNGSATFDGPATSFTALANQTYTLAVYFVPGASPTASPSSTPSSELLAIASLQAGIITVYPVGSSQPIGTYPPPSAPGAAPGTTKSPQLAVDASGNLYSFDEGLDTVFELAPPYDSATTIATLGGITPAGIAADAQGDVFVAPSDIFPTEGGIAIDLYTPPSYGTAAQLSVPAGINFAPACFAFDGQGDLFATNSDQYNGDPGTLEYAPPYTGQPVQLPFGGSASTGFSQGANCAVDTANGELFIGDATTVSAYAPPYTGAPVTISEPNTANTEQLAAAPGSGDLFVANGTAVDVYAPPYTSLTASVTTGDSSPNIVAVDASGNLFVGSISNGTITEYVPPYTGSPVWTLSIPSLGGTSYLVVIP